MITVVCTVKVNKLYGGAEIQGVLKVLQRQKKDLVIMKAGRHEYIIGVKG